MFYLSADNPIVSAEPFFRLANDIFMLGYDGLIIDEVHHIKDWSANLKAVYDAFPDKNIWASDSSSLVLRYGNADLSRRFLSVRVPLLSFREYLFLETGTNYPVWRFGDGKLPMEPDAEMLTAFEAYRAQGMCPYYQEGNFNERAMNAVNKTLLSDVPFFIPSVNENSLRLMSAIIGTLSASSIPRLNVTSLCADWNVGAEKLYKILRVMESVDLLRVLRYERDTKANSAGAKLFFADSSLYHVLHGNTGTEREAFVAMCFANAGFNVAASRDESACDFVVGKDTDAKIKIEVGGSNKKPKTSDFVLRDNISHPSLNAIPFWLLGMMW